MNSRKGKQKQSNVLGGRPSGRPSGKVQAPVASNTNSYQTGRNRMRFRERERIATIPGSVNFSNVASIPINPALAGSFPWLSGHAALFEKYCVRRLRFRYKNLKGTNSAGNVIMSFDYDTLDPAPGNAIQATQATHYIDGAPWRIFDLPVSPDKRDLFTRNGAVPGADLKTYDMGKLHISVEGCADTSDHGYLEVEYDIELFDKKPAEGVSTSVVDQFNLTANAVIAVNGIIPYDFGYRPVADSLFTNVGGVFTAKTKGTYLVCLQTVTSVAATRISVYKNGAFMVPQDVYDLPLSQYVQGSSVITLVEGDNISVHVSSATTISGNPAGFSGLTLTLIG